MIPVPLLDHVVVLLDDAAHADVVASDFVREHFGRVKPKTVNSSIAGRYSAFGVAGESTLLELFGQPLPGPRRLTGGLVFSFERPGSHLWARELLVDQAAVDAQHELVYREVPDRDERQPWYHMLRADLGADSPLLLFLNEVTPEYFSYVGARRGADGELLRSGYLDAAFGPATGRLLSDIVAVTIRVRADRAYRIAAVLGTLGYQSEQPYRLTGPGAEITLVVAGRDVSESSDVAGRDVSETEPEGVLEIVARLTRAPEKRRTLTFGDTSRLMLDPDGTARWTFTPVAV